MSCLSQPFHRSNRHYINTHPPIKYHYESAKTALRGSLPNDFDKHALAAFAVEFAVENLFPRPEVQLPVRDRHDDFATHDLAFQVGVGVVFAGAIVAILRGRLTRRELLQPDIVIVQEAVLGIIDVNAGGNVHRINEAKAFLHAALADQFLNGRRDVLVAAPARNLEPKMFSQGFHRDRIGQSGSLLYAPPWFIGQPVDFVIARIARDVKGPIRAAEPCAGQAAYRYVDSIVKERFLSTPPTLLYSKCAHFVLIFRTDSDL